MEKKYYLGGYYLIRLRPKNFGNDKGIFIYTCSNCINDNLVDVWSYSWTTNKEKYTEEVKNNYKFFDVQIDAIRTWIDNKFNENKLGWLSVFTDIETAQEYKNSFFTHLNDIKILALYFDEDERIDILNEFKPQTEKMREIGLHLTLSKGILETEHDKFLGYDYIGIEMDGSFHTFHCHDIGKELSCKFDLTTNEYGLFNSEINSKKVLGYLNDESTNVEPVPWFIAKTKIVTND